AWLSDLVADFFWPRGIDARNIAVAIDALPLQDPLHGGSNASGHIAALRKREDRGPGARNTEAQCARFHGQTTHLIKLRDEDGTGRFDQYIVHTPPDKFVVVTIKPGHQSGDVAPLR